MLFHSTLVLLRSFSTRWGVILLEPHNKVRVIDYTLKCVTYIIAQTCTGPMVHFVVYRVNRSDEVLSYALS